MATKKNVPVSDSILTLQKRAEHAGLVMKIKPAEVLSLLAEMGIEEDEDGLYLLQSETTKEDDAKPVFVDRGGVPIAKFRLGWAVLKGENKETAAKSETAKRPVTQWSDEDVIKAYGPDAPINVIAEVKKRGDDKRFIVFFPDGGVDVETTVTLLRLARRQVIPETYQVKGNLVRVYRVGEFPTVKFEECPLHGETLLVDGYCDKCKMSWKDIEGDLRIRIRVAKMAIPTLGDDYEKRMELFEKLGKGNNHELLPQILNSAPVNMLFAELKADGKLPILTRRTSSSMSGNGDPFFVHRTY